jgi:hypothetical protein
MRTAQTVMQEIVLDIQPPAGCSIVLTERTSEPTESNWIEACGPMSAEKIRRFNRKVAALRISDPMIDWSHEEMLAVGGRHVAHWMLLNG